MWTSLAEAINKLSNQAKPRIPVPIDYKSSTHGHIYITPNKTYWMVRCISTAPECLAILKANNAQ